MKSNADATMHSCVTLFEDPCATPIYIKAWCSSLGQELAALYSSIQFPALHREHPLKYLPQCHPLEDRNLDAHQKDII